MCSVNNADHQNAIKYIEWQPNFVNHIKSLPGIPDTRNGKEFQDMK